MQGSLRQMQILLSSAGYTVQLRTVCRVSVFRKWQGDAQNHPIEKDGVGAGRAVERPGHWF